MLGHYHKFEKNHVLNFFYDILKYATYLGFWKILWKVESSNCLDNKSDCRLRFLSKDYYWKYLSFLKIRIGTLSKLNFHFQKKCKLLLYLYKVLYQTTLMVFLRVFLMEYSKKEDTSNYQFFMRIPNLQSDMKSKQLEILTSHRNFS